MAGENGTTTIHGLAIEPYGGILPLWASFFVFGNLFAMFWLVRAFLNAHPEVAYQVRAALARVGLGGRRRRRRSSAGAHVASPRSGKTYSEGSEAAAAPDVAARDGSTPASPAAMSPGGRQLRHHHHHEQPIICTPSEEVHSGSLQLQASAADGVPGSPYAASSKAGGAADVLGAEGDSASSYSSEDDVVQRPMELEWRNMCYSVRTASGRRLIVQGIYGCAKPYQLQGLMGPSGAGKSTLMDLLSRRTAHDGADGSAAEAARNASAVASAMSGGDVLVPIGSEQEVNTNGQLLVNGRPMKQKDFMSISAYVPQHDNLVPTMTAYEAVSFYASIILPHDTPAHTRRAKITRVLRMMGLAHAQHTLVGGTLPGGIMLRGMSGGERKRLAIACGVVAGPSLVFLDEPTSGLDSFAALNVVLFLKSMATQRGASLLASLHQPRAAIWSQLDQVTLLANGRLMYTGATDGLVPWFTSLGYHYDPETHGMASDWALDLVALGFTKPQHGAQGAHHGEEDAAEEGAGGPDDAADATDGDDAAAQQPARRPGLRHRGAGAGGAGGALKPAPSTMASKQELFDASRAFVGHLQRKHPEWFPYLLIGGGPGDGAASEHNTARMPPVTESAAEGAEDDGGSPVRHSTLVDLEPDVVLPGHLPHLTTLRSFTEVGTDLAGPFATRQELLLEHEQEGHGQEGARGLWSRLASGFHKYRALLWRELLITTRNPADVGGRMMTFTYVAFISGLVSWSLPGAASSIFQRMSVAYAVLTFYFLMPFVFMSIFTSDKRFFAADTTARLYHPLQYYLSKVTVTLPFNVVVAVVFHLVYYGMAGMRHGAVYMAQSCVVCVLVGLIGMQAIYCCAIMASSQDLAFVYAIAWTSLNLLVNPYMLQYNLWSLGWGFSWLRFLSPCNFAWQALVRIEFKGRGFDCNQGSGAEALGLIPALLPDEPSFRLVRQNINNLGRISTNNQCVASGDAILDMYTSGLTLPQTVGVLLAFLVVFMAATYAVVRRSSKAKCKV